MKTNDHDPPIVPITQPNKEIVLTTDDPYCKKSLWIIKTIFYAPLIAIIMSGLLRVTIAPGEGLIIVASGVCLLLLLFLFLKWLLLLGKWTMNDFEISYLSPDGPLIRIAWHDLKQVIWKNYGVIFYGNQGKKIELRWKIFPTNKVIEAKAFIRSKVLTITESWLRGWKSWLPLFAAHCAIWVYLSVVIANSDWSQNNPTLAVFVIITALLIGLLPISLLLVKASWRRS
ncbi:MAG: hypothetical protein SFX18_05695 [Pirellulales bacterium]|nr:hypothetical protein [Pirellulales bacterium]